MTRMELHCPLCHHPSGNAIIADWPSPLEQRSYSPLICGVCGIDFEFTIDRKGMRSTAKRDQLQLAEFIDRRKRQRKVRS